jgi:hypothetical protein
MNATLILTLISAISGSLTGLLSSDDILSTGLSSLINASVAAGIALWSALKGGGKVTSELQSTLTALQAEYTAIQEDTSANPAVVGAIAEVSALVSDAITGFTNAATVDPGTLPVPPAVS